MIKMKNLFAVLVTLSLVFVGIPQSSKASSIQPCPMAASMADTAKTDSAVPCDKCPKMTEQQKSKGNCCGDDACSKQCAAMSLSSISMLNYVAIVSYPLVKESVVAFYDTLFNSSFLLTQDRPPKYLS